MFRTHIELEQSTFIEHPGHIDEYLLQIPRNENVVKSIEVTGHHICACF